MARAASLSLNEIVVPTGVLEIFASLLPSRQRLAETLTPEIDGAVCLRRRRGPTWIVTVAGR